MGRRDRAPETTTRRTGEVVIVSPAAELDMATAPRFVQAVEDARERSGVVVDLRALTFIDVAGIRALLEVSRGRDGTSTVCFIRASERVQQTLRLVGAEEALTWTNAPSEPASEAI
jgi:anti-anti-sigma factor